MASITASLHSQAVRYLPSGAYYVSSVLVTADVTAANAGVATLTASSKIYLAKVPLGAVIHDFTFYVDEADTANTWKLGLQLPEGLSGSWTATESALLAETASTLGPTLKPLAGKLPYKVTFTDTERFAWIVATCTGNMSASIVIRFSALLDSGQANS